jgi:hypothetical protein
LNCLSIESFTLNNPDDPAAALAEAADDMHSPWKVATYAARRAANSMARPDVGRNVGKRKSRQKNGLIPTILAEGVKFRTHEGLAPLPVLKTGMQRLRRLILLV